MLEFTPAVFVVGNTYQILVPVLENSLFWVEVGGKCYYDEQNGIMRSLKKIHRVSVPMSELDKAKKYTVCERVIIDRKPKLPLTKNVSKTEFSFKPLPEDNIRIYHIADAHNNAEFPIKAAKAFGNIDLLILNGDIPNHCGQVENFDTIYEIAEKTTGGSIPIVFARGNHDLRGTYAEEIADYTPNQNGNTYYTFKVGSIWGLILDCGEDKDDSHAEYGYTVACHCFRERQTEFIKNVIANRKAEYDDESVKYRFIIAHNPFSYQLREPFNIEKEIYSEWSKLIKENISPDLMICGHLHGLVLSDVGGKYDDLGQPCKLLVGSDRKDNYHAGCGITLKSGEDIKIDFTDSDGYFLTEKDINTFEK